MAKGIEHGTQYLSTGSRCDGDGPNCVGLRQFSQLRHQYERRLGKRGLQYHRSGDHNVTSRGSDDPRRQYGTAVADTHTGEQRADQRS